LIKYGLEKIKKLLFGIFVGKLNYGYSLLKRAKEKSRTKKD